MGVGVGARARVDVRVCGCARARAPSRRLGGCDWTRARVHFNEVFAEKMLAQSCVRHLGVSSPDQK